MFEELHPTLQKHGSILQDDQSLNLVRKHHKDCLLPDVGIARHRSQQPTDIARHRNHHLTGTTARHRNQQLPGTARHRNQQLTVVYARPSNQQLTGVVVSKQKHQQEQE